MSKYKVIVPGTEILFPAQTSKEVRAAVRYLRTLGLSPVTHWR